jgi:hypothetical protein
MRQFGWVVTVAALLGSPLLLRAQQPYEIGTAQGRLCGARISKTGSPDQFLPQDLGRWRLPDLRYDLEGKETVVGRGEGTGWEFISQGPDAWHIRATQGKWKGYYLRCSDRAILRGSSVEYLLELGKEPQVFYSTQVAR